MKRYAWIDIETTGLDPKKDSLVQMALVITDADYNEISHTESLIWQPKRVLEEADPFVRRMHTKNGLFAQVRTADKGLADVEKMMIKALLKDCQYGKVHLAGSSVSFDRGFLKEYMPVFESMLHYRQVDVSSFMVALEDWYGDDIKCPKPKSDHTALSDIRNSINQLKFYKERLKLS